MGTHVPGDPLTVQRQPLGCPTATAVLYAISPCVQVPELGEADQNEILFIPGGQRM